MANTATVTSTKTEALSAGATVSLLEAISTGERPMTDLSGQGLDRSAAAQFVLAQARMLNAVATSARLPTVRILAELLATQLAQDMDGSSN